MIDPTIPLHHVQAVVAQYERMMKEYPNAANLGETLAYWKEREAKMLNPKK